MDSLILIHPRLYRDECPAWLLTQHFGLSPTHCALYHRNTHTLPKMEISKAVWKVDPTKANQSNILPANQERKTQIQEAAPF